MVELEEAAVTLEEAAASEDTPFEKTHPTSTSRYKCQSDEGNHDADRAEERDLREEADQQK